MSFHVRRQLYQGEQNPEFARIIHMHALHPTATLVALTCKVTDHSQNFPHTDLEWGLNSALPHSRRIN